MNIILGASGQIGSYIANEIYKTGQPVRAIIRANKNNLNKNIEINYADYFNLKELEKAFHGGKTVFLITPENPLSNDILKETAQLIENYKEAIKNSEIKRIVGLSSIGAHLEKNTGNLLMSRLLENGFDDLNIEKIFVRPAYYFSNWMTYLETVRNYGILPAFFTEDFKIEMIAPQDVAHFCTAKILDDKTYPEKQIYELVGTEKYSPKDIANVFQKILNKNVTVNCIKRNDWENTLLNIGFTKNASKNLIRMTDAVVKNLVIPENESSKIKLKTTFEEYIKTVLKN